MRYWQGPAPEKCDICSQPIRQLFVDGATVHGPWAIMCSACMMQHGRGLGQGLGQQYRPGAHGRWFKAVG